MCVLLAIKKKKNIFRPGAAGGGGGGRKRRGKKGNLPNTFDDDCRSCTASSKIYTANLKSGDFFFGTTSSLI